jgi:hypothetical protein
MLVEAGLGVGDHDSFVTFVGVGVAVLLGVVVLWTCVLLVEVIVPSPHRWSRQFRAEINAAKHLSLEINEGSGTVVSRDDLRRHKIFAAYSSVVSVGLVGFGLSILLLRVGDDPNASIRWHEFVVGVAAAAVLACVVVHRYRSTVVSVVDAFVMVRNPWRTTRIDTTAYPMWRERRHGLARCVEFVGMDFVTSVTVVALPPELVGRLGLQLIDMDEAVAVATKGKRKPRRPFGR